MSQAEFWNGAAGETWATWVDTLDTMLKPLGEAAIAALAPQAGWRVLDIGCGAGATSRSLADKVGPTGHVTGVDISAPMLAVAQARGGGPDFVLADAGGAAIPGMPFDAAFSRFGVMFFEDPRASFAHLRSALQPGAPIVFICWRSMAENAWAAEPLSAAIPYLRDLPEKPKPGAPGPFAFADRAHVTAVLTGAGFADVSVTPFDTPYVMGATVEAAVDMSVRIGPLSRLIREQELEVEPIARSLGETLRAFLTPEGVKMKAACWIVRATA
jgi:SAM-dependent methyltransferase